MKTESEIRAYFERLWPLNRSLTGEGNRQTLGILSELVDMTIHETPSGTNCFDWVVPPEWNVKEAWIKDADGNIILDFAVNNLHVLGYSEPFSGTLHFNDLKAHLYTKPSQPEVIPYLTSYYQRRWGFCLSQQQFDSLDTNAVYEIFIDSSLNESGSMTWAESVLPGDSEKEIFFSTYICHPSMANDVLSGMIGQALLYQEISQLKHRHYTYRFIWIPETIGSIFYLSAFGENMKKNMMAGYVLTCLADPGNFTWKRSREQNSYTNEVSERVLKRSGVIVNIEDFWPGGSDERQYCSPAFNLPVGSLMRTRYEVFPEYHTSADNLSFISMNKLCETINLYMEIVKEIESTPLYISNNPHCEPLLGKRGLYPTLGAQEKYPEYIDAMMWVLNLADGKHDISAIQSRSRMSSDLIREITETLLKEGLIRRI